MSATQFVVALQPQQLGSTAVCLGQTCTEVAGRTTNSAASTPVPFDHNANVTISITTTPSQPGAVAQPNQSVPTVSPHKSTKTTAHKRQHSPANEDDGHLPVPAKRARESVALVGSTKKLFIYGNYDRYYGYRNAPSSAVVIGCDAEFRDIRLDAFRAHPNLFEAADCLDIGCNRGSVSLAVAGRMGARSMVGIDIDKSLIGQARLQLATEKRKQLRRVVGDNAGAANEHRFPHNVYFKHCNYVLHDEALLDLEQPQFDTILCLSVTKWIQLNFGDSGLKLAFRRMFRQLRCGGRLVLEAQPWHGYKRRKKLTADTERHFREIRLRPDGFEAYLLSAEVGFVQCWRMEAPKEHASAGFRRPILVFEKPMG